MIDKDDRQRTWGEVCACVLAAFGILVFVAFVTVVIVFAVWATIDEVIDRQSDGSNKPPINCRSRCR